MNIYISGRQFGKTTMLIKESVKTGATIAVATYMMAKYVQSMAAQMGLEIPEPVTYPEIFKTYHENRTKRYLVDELQIMLRQLNIDAATVDLEPIRYLNHWKYPDGYQPRLTICDESEIAKHREKMEKFIFDKTVSDALTESFHKHFFKDGEKGETQNAET